MTRPRAVAVMIPVKNETRALQTALGSLLSQSFEDWTCLVVDDGSEEAGAGSLVSFGDRRIRYIRLPRNLGRGAARQVALDSTEGDYLAMLDADDWWYPDKLSRQIEVLESNPEIGVVASSLAVEQTPGVLQAVWRAAAPGSTRIVPPLGSALRLPVSHGTIVVRRHLALEVGYDRRLRRSEDRVFLSRVLSRTACCVLGDPLYVYRPSEPSSDSRWATRYVWRARAFSRLVPAYPLSAALGCLQSLIQAGVASTLRLVGASGWSTLRRPQRPTDKETEDHRLSWHKVEEMRQALWGVEARREARGEGVRPGAGDGE